MSSPLPEPIQTSAVRVSTRHGDLWLAADDAVMLPYLQSSGEWERAEEELLSSLMTPTTRFLDVGANVGYFSVFAARRCPGGSIDAVEPLPANLGLLRMNLFLHAAHATIWPLALGDRRDVFAMTIDPVNYGNTRVDAVARSGSVLAPVVPGDMLFPGRTFDVIKVDVQGFELDVVRGLRETLSRGGVAVVEFMPGAIVERGLHPLEVLKGYRAIGLDVTASVAGRLDRLDDGDLLHLCRSAGPDGFVNLVLHT